MAINGFNSVSTAATNAYTTASQNLTQQASTAATTAAQTVQNLPEDTLALGGKSLFTGVSISAQIAKNRRSEAPGDKEISHVGASPLKTGRNVAIISGLISTAQNTLDFVNGTITGSRATGNITSDVVGGFGGGLVAAGTGSLAANLIGSSMGAGITGLIVGTAAFAGADILYRKSGAYQKVSDAVTTFIDNIFNRLKQSGGW